MNRIALVLVYASFLISSIIAILTNNYLILIWIWISCVWCTMYVTERFIKNQMIDIYKQLDSLNQEIIEIYQKYTNELKDAYDKSKEIINQLIEKNGKNKS